MSSYFALRFDSQPFVLFLLLLTWEILLVKYACRHCEIIVEHRDTLADLIIHDMIDINVLMGMGWLSLFYASID